VKHFRSQCSATLAAGREPTGDERTESPDGSRRAANVGRTAPDGSRRTANVGSNAPDGSRRTAKVGRTYRTARAVPLTCGAMHRTARAVPLKWGGRTGRLAPCRFCMLRSVVS
jgi:hypothetical protein